MKEDVGELPSVPKKRRAVEAALDLHLAMWLDGDLTPSERRRLQAEKDRRKALVPEVKLGVLVGDEGLSPNQLAAVIELLEKSSATEVHHGWVSSKLHSACLALGGPVTVENTLKDVVKESQTIIAAPKEMSEPPGTKRGVWEMIRYAKHRNLPVKVVLADGKVMGEE